MLLRSEECLFFRPTFFFFSFSGLLLQASVMEKKVGRQELSRKRGIQNTRNLSAPGRDPPPGNYSHFHSRLGVKCVRVERETVSGLTSRNVKGLTVLAERASRERRNPATNDKILEQECGGNWVWYFDEIFPLGGSRMPYF